MAIGDLRLGLGCKIQPTETPATDDTMNLQELVGRSAEVDFLREMIGFAARQLMDLKVGSLTGCGYGAKITDWLRFLKVSTGSTCPGRGRTKSGCAIEPPPPAGLAVRSGIARRVPIFDTPAIADVARL